MADNDKRLRYYNGQFLREQDFTDEQEYHLDRQRRHNRLLHTYGIVEGLTVTANAGASSATVSPGTAIDGEGRTIVLTESRSVLIGSLTNQWVLVVISYKEQVSDPSTAGDEGHTRWWERPDVEVIAEAGAPPADLRIRLARLQVGANGTISQHDTAVRSSAGKLGAGSLKVQNPLGVAVQFVQDQNGNQSPLAIGTGPTVGIGTSTPGFVLTVAGNVTTAPLAEVHNRGNEASIRYMNLADNLPWHVGTGGQGGAKNFFFWNEEKGVVGIIKPDGTLTVNGLKASTSAPGFVFTVSGNSGTAPIAEMKNQGNEASIRYVNSDSVAWHVGSGGNAGPGTFFFWNNQKQYVATITPDGALAVNGLKVNTSAPGLALTVAGNSGTAPLVEVKNQGNEASVRYVNNDGVAWHVGSGGQGGAKNFFFWSQTNGIVGAITPEGDLTAKGGLNVGSGTVDKMVLTVEGDRPAPLVEVRNKRDEATIRYLNRDNMAWHVGTGGLGGAKNFTYWNQATGVVATITPEGALTAKGLKASTTAPGIVLTAAGNTDTAPLVEMSSQGNEASIRYVNNDGVAWHVGTGGASGAKNFFFWNSTNGIVVTATPDGTVTVKGGLTVNNVPLASTAPAQNRLKQLMIDPDTGKIYRAN